MVLPNFLFIGTGKSGSTSLYYYLKQHPDVFMSPVKETNFFSYEGGRPDFCGPGDRKSMAHKMTITTITDYERNFSGVTTEKAIGEVSPSYLYIPKAPSRIRHYIPKAKLIAILRNPVDRAYSAFAGYIKSAREPLTDFTRAVREEPQRIADNWSPSWHYVQNGFYYEQLKRYFALFPADQIKIYLFEDWIIDAPKLIKDVFGFIGVDDQFKVDLSESHNQSGRPKSRLLYNLMNENNHVKTFFKPLLPKPFRKKIFQELQSTNLERLPKLSPEIRQQLILLYRKDILKLQDLLNRDLSNWL